MLSTKVGRLLSRSAAARHAGVRGGASPFEVALDYSYDGTLRSLEHSLQRLGTNAIDIVLIHDVNRRWQGDLLEQRYARGDGAARIARSHELRAQGAIKAFGVGVNDWSILLRFAADGDFDCFMLAGRYTLLDHTALDTFLPDCERRGIAVLMAAPFNSGILATGARPGATYFYTERRRRDHGAHAAHRGRLRAARRGARRRRAAVPARASGRRERRHGHAQRRPKRDANIAHCRAPIPRAFWDELKHRRLIAADAPVPAGA